MADQALSGVRALELAQGVAGPYAGNLMAGLGAEVVKVEPPAGDWSRRVEPVPGDVPHPEKSPLFLYLNMGKKSVTLELDTPRGRELLLQLASEVEVLFEDFPPGQLDSLGIGYRRLEEANPALVVVSITPFGQTGPYRNYKATELVIIAMSGLMRAYGEPDREPIKPGGWMGQYHVGTQAFGAALVALYDSQLTGRGQQVDISAMEAMQAANENAISNWAYNYEHVQRGGNVGRAGGTGLFRCRDGIAVLDTVIGDFPSFERFAVLTEVEELRDPAFKDPDYRREHAGEINELIRPWVESRTKSEIYHVGQAQRLPFGFVSDTRDLLGSPQLKARDFFVEVAHPCVGTLTYPGPPFKMTETPWQAGRAPLLGEHNEEVYGGVGP